MKRLAYVIFLGISTLLLAEGAARLLDLGPERFHHPWHLESPNKHHGLDVYPSNPRGAFDLDLRDPATFDTLKKKDIPHLERARSRTPYAVAGSYNAELCRQDPVGPNKEGQPRVLIIGDSFSEGQGVSQDQPFAPVLQKLLADQGHEIEVINCGRRGYNFPDLLEWTERHLPYEPDLVVYAMILNDPVLTPEFKKRQKFIDDWILDRRRMVLPNEHMPETPWWRPRLWSIWQEAKAKARVGRETTTWYQEVLGEPNQAGFEETLVLMQRMRDASEKKGARFVVVMLPLLVGLEGDYPFDEAHRTMARACKEHKLDFFDLLPAFSGKNSSSLWVHETDRHPNEIAHRIIARGLIKPVLDRLGGKP